MPDFLGLPYPIVNTPNGLIAQSSGVEQIKADLTQLLLTNPGSRCMLPLFGTPLSTLFFQPNDNTTLAQAKQMISNAIKTWEPRIIVQGITVMNSQTGLTSNMLNPNDDLSELGEILFIRIDFFDPGNISVIQSLTLNVPLGGG